MALVPCKSTCPGARYLAFFLAALSVAALLSGCGPAETGLQRDAARQLQCGRLSFFEVPGQAFATSGHVLHRRISYELVRVRSSSVIYRCGSQRGALKAFRNS